VIKEYIMIVGLKLLFLHFMDKNYIDKLTLLFVVHELPKVCGVFLSEE
jgi:hypothetical protein